MRSDICIGQNFFGAIFTQVNHNLFFWKNICTQISVSPLKFETLGRFSIFWLEDFLEIRLYESKLYKLKNYMSWNYMSWNYMSWNYMSRNYMKCYWAEYQLQLFFLMQQGAFLPRYLSCNLNINPFFNLTS